MTHLKCGHCNIRVSECSDDRCAGLFELYGEIFCTPEGHFCPGCTCKSTVRTSEN